MKIALLTLFLGLLIFTIPVTAESDLSYWLEAPLPDHDYWDLDISSGPHKPGDELMIDIDNIYLPGNFSYVLIKLNDIPEIIQQELRVIPFELAGDKNKTLADWKTHLPMDIPARYLFGFSVNSGYETRYMVEQIIVDEIDAELWLNQTVVKQDGYPQLYIRNNGITHVEYRRYGIERKIAGEWVDFDTGLVLSLCISLWSQE